MCGPCVYMYASECKVRRYFKHLFMRFLYRAIHANRVNDRYGSPTHCTNRIYYIAAMYAMKMRIRHTNTFTNKTEPIQRRCLWKNFILRRLHRARAVIHFCFLFCLSSLRVYLCIVYSGFYTSIAKFKEIKTGCRVCSLHCLLPFNR